MVSAEKANVAEKLSRFDEQWSPKIVGELNAQHVKLVKLLGEFVWHHHDDEDEMFLVVDGRFKMEFWDREVWLERGEFIVVPRGGRAQARCGGGGQRDALRARVDAKHGQRDGRDDGCRVGQDLKSGRWMLSTWITWIRKASRRKRAASSASTPASSREN